MQADGHFPRASARGRDILPLLTDSATHTGEGEAAAGTGGVHEGGKIGQGGGGMGAGRQ